MFEKHMNKNDRTNFKRSNVFGAYVNAMFNGGVFVNPAQD
jgi:hypothetical protein